MSSGTWSKKPRKGIASPDSRPAAVAESGRPAERSEWRKHALPVLVLWGLALLAYSSSFRSGLPFDSGKVVEDSRIHAVTAQNLNLIFTQDYWYKNAMSGLYRPVTTLSYAFNYAVLGNGANPAPYHWVNFGLQAVNILLVYLLALVLLREMPLALGMAAVWCVHPVLTESVTNMVGRADQLAGFGVLAGLLCHIRAANASGRRKAVWLTGLALATAVGVFSKESGIVVIAALAIYDFTFRPDSWRRLVSGYAAAAAPLLAFLYVRAGVMARIYRAPIPFVDNPLVGADFWTARLTAIKVIGKYLALLVWPIPLSCDYSFNQIPLFGWRFDNAGDWGVLAALAALAALAVVAALCWRRQKAAFFFLAFFFAVLAPTSNLLLLIGTIMAERFLYLPALAFAGCLVLAVHGICGRLGAKRAAPVAIAVICAAFAVRTFVRNFDWSDGATLWASAARTSPDSYRAHDYLAAAWVGDPRAHAEAAIRETDRSLAILDPLPDERNAAGAYSDAGRWYRIKGDLVTDADQREHWYRKSMEVLWRGQRVDRATSELVGRENLRQGRTVKYTGWPPVYIEMGQTYVRLGEPQKAVDALHYARVLRQDPQASDELANAYRAMGDWQQAAVSLLEGLSLDPTQTAFASKLADLYKEKDPNGCALLRSGGAVSLDPNCPMVREQLCTASRNVARLYVDINQRAQAAEVARGAVEGLGCPAQMFQ